jgi:hypothetical protein
LGVGVGDMGRGRRGGGHVGRRLLPCQKEKEPRCQACVKISLASKSHRGRQLPCRVECGGPAERALEQRGREAAVEAPHAALLVERLEGLSGGGAIPGEGGRGSGARGSRGRRLASWGVYGRCVELRGCQGSHGSHGSGWAEDVGRERADGAADAEAACAHPPAARCRHYTRMHPIQIPTSGPTGIDS